VAHYKAVLSYDGTAFEGFQAQPGRRTVEGEVRSALSTLGWQGRTLSSGGRTDAGVHAAGQVAVFELDWGHSALQLQRALNALLPGDISCRGLEAVSAEFHPRYQALRRCYRYRVLLSEWRDPLSERYALRIWPAPDEAALEGAAELLPGRRNFGAFGSAPRKGSHTVRTVYRSEWHRNHEFLEYWIEADAFLFRMVRTIVGTLLEAGRGKRSLEAVAGLLEEPPHGRSGPAAGAQGLCLMRIDYPSAAELHADGVQAEDASN
jgi:tRNA pseudouridine38-40 synthase